MKGLAMPTAPVASDLELIDDLFVEWDATERSKINARYTLVAFAGWLAGRGSDLAAATQADCVAWLRERRDQVAAATVVKNWGQLRAFYAIAADDAADVLGGRRSPMARVPQPHAPTYVRTKAARCDEFDALLSTFDRRSTLGLRNATMCSLMFRSGLRVGELPQLDLADVDVEARRVLIADTKNGEPRRPPIHPETMALLRRYLRRRGDRPGPLFLAEGPRRRSDRLRVNSVQNVVKRAAARAGVSLTPHTLRRGWWAEYVEHGGDVVTGMHIAGWSREVMPHRYLADRRGDASQTVFDAVAARQLAARRRRLHSVS
jgi:integrase/recombinase XerD